MVPGLYDLSFEDDVYLNNGQGYTPIDNDAVETNHEMQIKVNQMEEDLSTRSSSVRLESP